MIVNNIELGFWTFDLWPSAIPLSILVNLSEPLHNLASKAHKIHH